MSCFAGALCISDEVKAALSSDKAVVALESTVITHGLPYPENMRIAQEMEGEVRQLGGIPATIGVLDGLICVGLNTDQLEKLAQTKELHKISRRDFGPALALGWSGGTTVAGTMLVANSVKISVFATGGIGGVHRQPAYDISPDLPELARTPMIVVCAGAKAILDLSATLEYLETASVPVLGYQTDKFPAFFSRSSGLEVNVRVDTPEQVISIAQAHWDAGNNSAVLVVNPLPENNALPRDDVERVVQNALAEAAAQGIRGQAMTPFLLNRVSALTGGGSLQANLELLRNNARLGAEISVQLSKKSHAS
jgi:pseudouridine-5'-phosphate glycosidase